MSNQKAEHSRQLPLQTKKQCRYLHIRSLTATATSTLSRLCTHQLFKTVKSWTPQSHYRESQVLVKGWSLQILIFYGIMCVLLLNIPKEYRDSLTQWQSSFHCCENLRTCSLQFVSIGVSCLECDCTCMDSEEYVAFQLLTGMSQSLCMSHGPCEQQTAWAVWPADHIFIFYTIRTWNLNLPLHITLRLHNHNCFIFSN